MIETFQTGVANWLSTCFGMEIAQNVTERNHRFIEEALELVQACGGTASECHQLVDYVFSRPVGDKEQEVGGVMVTLAALCFAQDLNMDCEGEKELRRVWKKIIEIRAKQAAKPKHSPLPETVRVSAEARVVELEGALGDLINRIERAEAAWKQSRDGATILYDGLPSARTILSDTPENVTETIQQMKTAPNKIAAMRPSHGDTLMRTVKIASLAQARASGESEKAVDTILKHLEDNSMNEQQIRERIVELDKEIDAIPCWGAAVGAMCEERDALAKRLGMKARRVPVAD